MTDLVALSPVSGCPSNRDWAWGVSARTSFLLAVALLAAACGGTGPAAENACEAAFAAEVNPAGGGNGVDALDEAITNCVTIDEWTSAWTKFPNSHGSAVDPMVFLEGRCLSGDLAGTALCSALAGPAAVYYADCAAVRAAGKAPLAFPDPGYRFELDDDDDGVACE